MQPHTPLFPPPPHVWYAGRPWLAHVQRKVPPQPLEKSPHWFGYAAHVKRVGQLHVPGVLAVVELQTFPVPEQAQSIVPPQPSSSFEPHLPAYEAAHVRRTQQVLFAPHTALAGHVQLTEPQELLTVVAQAPLHVGNAQQVWLTASQACPAAHLQAMLPQALLNVTLHCPPQTGSAQQVPAVPAVFELHALPAAHAQLSVAPQPSGRAEPHCPL